MTATVRILTLGPHSVIEVDPAEATTLDPAWRQAWAAAGREARADWCSAGPGNASVRVATDRAGALQALVEELEVSTVDAPRLRTGSDGDSGDFPGGDAV